MNDLRDQLPDDGCPMGTDLRRLATDPEYLPPGWTAEEITDFRRLAQCARAARCPTDLLNMRSLHVERDETRRPHGAKATLRSGRTIFLTFNNAVTFEEPRQ